MGKMLQAALKRPLVSKKCRCLRCRSADLVRYAYPSLDDMQVLAVATEITKTLQRAVVKSERRRGGAVGRSSENEQRGSHDVFKAPSD